MKYLGTSIARLLVANLALGAGVTVTTSNLSEDQIAERDRLDRERASETRQLRRQKERLAKKGRG